jgi:hypothetical protein
MAKNTPLNYSALNEQLAGIVDEFSALRPLIAKHVAPQPELKVLRGGLDDWTKEIVEDLEMCRSRVAECGEAFAAQYEPAAAPAADEKDAIEAAVAAATAPEGESTEGEAPTPEKAKRSGRTAVPA